MNKETSLQIAVSTWLKYSHPDVIFTAESSGIKLTIGQAVKAKKQRSPERGLPDMIVLEPRGEYHGLCLEFKTETPFKQDGTLKASEHLREQLQCIKRLNEKGYYSKFAIGFDDAVNIITKYLTHAR